MSGREYKTYEQQMADEAKRQAKIRELNHERLLAESELANAKLRKAEAEAGSRSLPSPKSDVDDEYYSPRPVSPGDTLVNEVFDEDNILPFAEGYQPPGRLVFFELIAFILLVYLLMGSPGNGSLAAISSDGKGGVGLLSMSLL